MLSQGRQDESPSFAPNGATLIYATQDRGRGVLATVSIDGRVQQRLAASTGDVREPVWSPFPAKLMREAHRRGLQAPGDRLACGRISRDFWSRVANSYGRWSYIVCRRV